MGLGDDVDREEQTLQRGEIAAYNRVDEKEVETDEVEEDEEGYIIDIEDVIANCCSSCCRCCCCCCRNIFNGSYLNKKS